MLHALLRRHRLSAAIIMFAAAFQLVLAPALRLCNGTHHGQPGTHATTHAMHHGASHQQPTPSHEGGTPAGDDHCLVMRGCEAVAVATPELAAAAPAPHLAWPAGDQPMPESIDRAPDAPPPRA